MATRVSDEQSFGFLPWITVLLTAVAVLFACIVAIR